jgi:hypothetical protein
MKAITKWPGEYVWGTDGRDGESWGGTGGVVTDGRNSGTSGKHPQTISRPRKPATAGKRARAPSVGPAQSGQRSPEGAAAGRRASGGNPWGGGGAAGWFLLGVLGRSGARSWGAGPARPILTMPGRSAYLGSAMAAARRGWGTRASVEPGPVETDRREARSESPTKAKGAAEEQEVSRQE